MEQIEQINGARPTISLHRPDRVEQELDVRFVILYVLDALVVDVSQDQLPVPMPLLPFGIQKSILCQRIHRTSPAFRWAPMRGRLAEDCVEIDGIDRMNYDWDPILVMECVCRAIFFELVCEDVVQEIATRVQ